MITGSGILSLIDNSAKAITQNKNERYQCIESVPSEQDSAGEGLAALGIDFKRYFTLPTDELYKRIALGLVRRRCRLKTPYAEQLASRFFYFQSRIALPQDHQVPM